MLLRNSLNLPTEQKHVTDVFDIKDFYCRDIMNVFLRYRVQNESLQFHSVILDILSTSVTVV